MISIIETIETSPEYLEKLRKTFNYFPEKGKFLHIAGKDQPLPANPIDQAIFDDRFRQIAKAGKKVEDTDIKDKILKTSKNFVEEHPYLTGGAAAATLVAGIGAAALRKHVKKDK
jgi:hypothetical protein